MALLIGLSLWWAPILISLGWVLWVIYEIFASPVRRIPGPSYTLVTRLPLKYYSLTGRRLHYIHALHEQYGPIVRISPHEIAVADPESFAAIHRIGSGFTKSAWYDSAPEGIFSMRDPKTHAQRRKLFARAFSATELRANWEDVVRDKVELAVSKIQGEAKEHGEVDVMKWWTLMATDVIGHLSFGESFEMLEIGRKTEYIDVLESALINSNIRAELPLLHAIIRNLPIPSIQVFVRSGEYLYRYGARAVTNLRNQSGNAANLFGTMLATLESEISSQKATSLVPLTDHQVQTEAGNLILAGSDTTAVSLTYLVWAVLKNPDLQRRLEDEVAGLPERFDDAVLEKLPLLEAVINETLRLYGAAPGGLPRSVPKGGATLGGYYIPEDFVVETQAYTLHRNADIFPDPLKFDESRFLDPQKRTKAEKSMFTPFGAGSRICIGMHLARTELRLAAAVFFRKCPGAKLSKTMTDEMMEMENYFLIAPRGHTCKVVL
ncbi:cytochrome P450 [Dactylonectria estremocensis]|uniref:Cytochrome P450 n=1 Tax=Dactylonectria estremocensis TaxID=1079267 RepID=A0A9P9DMD7_9HYPO|nr:cytochrome P450 [Dactylonectria estremocensis]